VVGAAIMQALDWRWIFWINLPIVLLSAALLALFYRGRERDPNEPVEGPIAVMPSLYLCGVLLAVMVALVHGRQLSATLWMACAAVGGVAAWRLAGMQRRGGPDALFPAGLLRVRMVGLASASAFLCGAIAMGLTVYLPSFAALILRADYLAISATVGVMTLTWTFSGIAVGVVVKSRRFRLMAGIAAALVLVGSLALCLSARYLAGVSALLAISGLLGLGLGACSVIFSVALQSAVPDAVRGSATSLFYLSRMLGQAIGVALCGGVLASSDPQARALMRQLASGHGDATATRHALAQAASMTGAVRAEFVVVFALIAGLAALQCLLSFRTPGYASAPAAP
jgi:MFS family permease